MKYQDNDHTPDEVRMLEKFVQHFADRYPDYYRHIQKAVAKIKSTSKLEALQFELDAMIEYDRTVRPE